MAHILKRKNTEIWYLIDKKFKPARWTKLGRISKPEARAVLLRYETEKTYLRLGMKTPSAKMTLTELCDEYVEQIKLTKAASTVYVEEMILQKFCEKFGSQQISALSANDVLRYCKDRGYRPYSTHNLAKSLRGAFNLANAREYHSTNPIIGMKLPKIEELPPRAVDPKLIFKVMKFMSGAILDYYSILAYTGMRPGEAVALRARDITEHGVTVFATKTGRFRTVPIHRQLKATLKRLAKGKRPEDFLFPGKDGHQKSFKMGLRRACEDAGVTISRYSIRHTFATQVLKNTGDLRAVQTLLGHSKSTMTERYAHSLSTTLAKAVATLRVPRETHKKQ